MRFIRAAPIVVVIVMLTPLPADAQQDRTRGFVAVNFAAQEGPQRLSLAVPVEVFGTSGVLEIDDDIVGGAMFDVSAGLRGRRFGFGGGFSRTSTKSAHQFTASTIPFSPGSFQRTANGVTPPLEHKERVIYVFGALTRAVTDRFDVMVSAGPSVFQLTQGIPESVEVTESAAIRRVPTRIIEDSAIGFHSAVDFTYFVAPQFGIGGLVRYSWGSVELPDSTKSQTLGGLNIGAGARLRF